VTPISADLAASGLDVEVRAPDPADAIDGVLPSFVALPRTAAGAARTLQWASSRRLSLVIRGSGTKAGWGRVPRHIDGILDMSRLTRILSHHHGDLTATVEAGITLHDMNRALSVYRQWLPLDPPFAHRASIGGLLATNDSGPLRHRSGTPRDLIIGATLATPDGVLARSGGQVVKNVAGYDLSRLVTGSFGSLAVIVSATFKLSPLPGATATLVMEPGDETVLGELAAAAAASHVEPAAFEIHVRRGPERAHSGLRVLLRFAGVPPAVEAQASDASGRAGALGVQAVTVSGEREQDLWREHSSAPWSAAGAVARFSWMPGDVVAMIRTIGVIGAQGPVEMIGRAGVGAGLIRIDGDASRQAAAIEWLRRTSSIGNVVLIQAVPELKAQVDVWPESPNEALLASVKKSLDPAGTLGAGRGMS
jgi:glycolate oxidase FAD binding subunit